jgi:hypothetical protein
MGMMFTPLENRSKGRTLLIGGVLALSTVACDGDPVANNHTGSPDTARLADGDEVDTDTSVEADVPQVDTDASVEADVPSVDADASDGDDPLPDTVESDAEPPDVPDVMVDDADVLTTTSELAAQYCADRARSYCAAIYSDSPCAAAVQEAQRYAERFDVWDADACESLNTDVCVGSMVSIADGYVEFDADIATTCVQALELLDCAERLAANIADFDACQGVTTGLQGTGDSCHSSRDCADAGQTCVDYRPPVDGVLTGVCRTRGDVGDSCNFDDDCQEGLVCDPGSRKCAAES